MPLSNFADWGRSLDRQTKDLIPVFGRSGRTKQRTQQFGVPHFLSATSLRVGRVVYDVQYIIIANDERSLNVRLLGLWNWHWIANQEVCYLSTIALIPILYMCSNLLGKLYPMSPRANMSAFRSALTVL